MTGRAKGSMEVGSDRKDKVWRRGEERGEGEG